jgi:DNA topoisomerase-1
VDPASIEIQDARSAGLRYVDDTMPGIRRKRRGGAFAYIDSGGKPIKEKDELARIRALAIPPAYEDVWICPLAHGHVQATARDAKGRKQYRYHKRWREVRDANKYESTLGFAAALPALRARVESDLAKADMSRDKVLASVVRMLESTLVRVGNESYARDNGSFGLTTLRARHVRVEGEKRIRLKFRGKSGVEHAVTIEDRRLARTVKRCRDLPGETLFCYVDDEGNAQPVTSDDVNSYIRDAGGADFSAKDFRTWSATVICALALDAAGRSENLGHAKQNVATAVATAAARLGNSAAVCRTSYIHPLVIETYLDELSLALPKASRRPKSSRLDADERRVLAFLEKAKKKDARAARVGLLRASLKVAESSRRLGRHS